MNPSSTMAEEAESATAGSGAHAHSAWVLLVPFLRLEGKAGREAIRRLRLASKDMRLAVDACISHLTQSKEGGWLLWIKHLGSQPLPAVPDMAQALSVWPNLTSLTLTTPEAAQFIFGVQRQQLPYLNELHLPVRAALQARR